MIPLAGFDTETTGVDPRVDRVVSWAVVESPTHTVGGLIDPGVPIPAGAAAVHGITDEQAKSGEAAAVGVSRIVVALQAVWGTGAAVVGHNIAYDMTILDSECRRHLGQPFEVDGPVIDTLVFDKHMDPYRKGSRNLAATCAHYGVEFDAADAHGATADAVAALRLGQRLLRGWSKADLTQLHADQMVWADEQQRSYAAWARSRGRQVSPELGWPVRAA